LYFALMQQVTEAHQSMAVAGGLCGLAAGVGLEQSRKRFQDTLRRAQSVKHQIEQQTRGRIHELNVRVADGRTYVDGYTSSYCLMQLARSATLDVLGASDESNLEFNVRVRKAVN
jgi:hypothetical protein